MRAPGQALLPRGLRLWLGLLAAFVAIFALTAPWRVGGREIGRLSAALGVAIGLGLASLCLPAWRRALSGLVREGIAPVSRRTLLLASGVAAAFLARVVFARYASLDLNAWDTTLFFDHPIAATLSGRLLFCDYLGQGELGVHPSYILLAFTPLYAIVASPAWLLVAEALAVAAGGAAGFLVLRRVAGDDLAGALLAAAFVLDSHTARAVQYGFHVEAFYPLAIFLLWLGLLEERGGLAAAGTILAVSIKEDSLLVLLGFALVAALFLRRRRLAAAVAAAAILAFLVSSRLVAPHFSGAPAERPWYATYWATWGDSLPRAALGMARHPVALARTLANSGIPHLFEPLLFLPLAGPEGLVAALPQLVPYGAADFRPLRDFSLYYALPILPFLFVGTAYGLARLTSSLPRRRLGALAVLLVCALDGAGYSFPRARAGARRDRARPRFPRRPSRARPGIPLSPRRLRREPRGPRSRASPPAGGVGAPRPRHEPVPADVRRSRRPGRAARRGCALRPPRHSRRARPLRPAGRKSVGHLLVLEAEHVADLVDDGVADLADGLAARLAEAQDRAAEDGDLGGQARDHVRTVEERGAAEDPEELLLLGRVGLVVVLGRGLLLDGHDDVFQILPKDGRDRGERLLDAGLELGGAGMTCPTEAREGLTAVPLRKRRSKFAVVAAATVSTSTPLTSASFFAVSTTNAGSHGLPRCGTGERNGVSVSTSIASRGRPAAAERMFSAARNVIIPEKDTRYPRPIAAFP